jgi:hypothetical protein
MKPEKDVEKLIEEFQVKPGTQMRRQMLADVLQARSETQKTEAGVKLGLMRTIMKSKMTKAAIAATIVLAAIGVFGYFGKDGTSTAFAKTLALMQQSYTCKLSITTTEEGKAASTADANLAVLEPGRVRAEWTCQFGRIDTVCDLTNGKSMMLFPARKAGVINGEGDIGQAEGGIFATFTQPMENLWNLKDGSQTGAGSQEIEGRQAVGYRIVQDGKEFRHDITIWADSSSGEPVLVEAVLTAMDGKPAGMHWTMKDFHFGVQLAREDFSLEVPAGYTLAHSRDVNDLGGPLKASDEATNVGSVLSLWADGRKEDAITTLLTINWSSPMEFGRKPYIFGMTEKDFISLDSRSQQKVIDDVQESGRAVKEIVTEVQRLAAEATQRQDYNIAEKYLAGAMGLGRVMDHDQRMVIVRLIGAAVEKKALGAMVELYTASQDQQKLKAANEQLEALNAQAAEMKKKALGQ